MDLNHNEKRSLRYLLAREIAEVTGMVDDDKVTSPKPTVDAMKKLYNKLSAQSPDGMDAQRIERESDPDFEKRRYYET